MGETVNGAPEEKLTSPLPFLIGTFLLATAMIVRWGDGPAILFATALLLFGIGTFAPLSKVARFGSRALSPIAIAGLAGQLGWAMSEMPMLAKQAPVPMLTDGSYGWAACGACAVAAIAFDARRARTWLVVAAVLSAFMCISIVRFNPAPYLDVHLFHLQAFDALRAGQSPYGRTIPNLYPGANFYGLDVLTPDQSRVLIGYPYPPLQLMLSFVTHLLAGNYRFLHALAIPLSALLMVWARPGRAATAAAALMLLLPCAFHLLTGAWTEPVLALLFSLTLFASLRAPRLLPYALGLFFADKQYALLLAPLAFFLLPRPLSAREIVRTALIAGAVGLAVSLPLALGNLQGFIDDVLLFQVRQPFRPDSINLSAAIFAHTAQMLSSSVSFIALALGLGLSVWRAPRTPLGFCAAAALSLGLFFFFAKQAFENYLMFVSCCALWAAALSGSGETEAARGSASANVSAAAASPIVVEVAA